MRNSFSKYASILTYLGITPFWLSAIAVIWDVDHEYAWFVFRTYGAVIIAFICGIHWAISMKDIQRKTMWLLVTSTTIALLAWFSTLIHHYHPINGLAVIAGSLFLLLYIDFLLYKQKQIELWFMRLRWRATLLVISAIIGLGIKLQ